CGHLEQLAVAGHRDGIAAEGAVGADRGGHVVVPVAGPETGRLVGEDAGRADVDQVAGEGGFQLPLLLSPEIDGARAPHDAEIGAPGILLIEAGAAVALDAAVHLVFDKGTEILIDVCPLQAVVAPDAVAAGDGEVLELALPPLVADRAVVGVIDHQPFDDGAAHGDRFRVGRRYHHAVLGRQHAGHLDPLDRPLQHPDGADPAGAGPAESGMPAEMRDGDTDAARGLQDIGAFGNLNGYGVDDYLWHGFKLS